MAKFKRVIEIDTTKEGEYKKEIILQVVPTGKWLWIRKIPELDTSRADGYTFSPRKGGTKVRLTQDHILDLIDALEALRDEE